MNRLEAVIVWIGLVLSVVIMTLSVRARNAPLGSLGLLLGVLSWIALRRPSS